MPSLAHSLLLKPVFWVTSFLSWKTGMGNRMKTPVQGKMIRNLIHHLDTILFGWMGSAKGDWGNWRKYSLSQLPSLPTVLAHQGGSSWPEVGKRDTHQQEELEEGSGELQTCQPDCEAEESHGSSWEPSWDTCRTTRIRPSQQGFKKGRSCLTNLIFYDRVQEGSAKGSGLTIVWYLTRPHVRSCTWITITPLHAGGRVPGKQSSGKGPGHEVNTSHCVSRRPRKPRASRLVSGMVRTAGRG